MVLPKDLQEHVGNAENSVGGKSRACAQGSDGMVGAVDVGTTVNQKEGAITLLRGL